MSIQANRDITPTYGIDPETTMAEGETIMHTAMSNDFSMAAMEASAIIQKNSEASCSKSASTTGQAPANHHTKDRHRFHKDPKRKTNVEMDPRPIATPTTDSPDIIMYRAQP